MHKILIHAKNEAAHVHRQVGLIQPGTRQKSDQSLTPPQRNSTDYDGNATPATIHCILSNLT